MLFKSGIARLKVEEHTMRVGGLTRLFNTVKAIMVGYVMVDQREALPVTTGFTDTFFFIRPPGIKTVDPWVSNKQQPCILPLSKSN